MNTALAAADLNGSKEPLARLVYVRPARKYLARSSLAGCGKSRSVVLPARFVAFCPFVTR